MDWGDKNLPYLLLGLLAFWGPTLGYWWSLRSRAFHLGAEAELLQEEIAAD
ncbi:MAG: hypothetical protein M3220_01040 [Chloroflexota bacterium]|nr:hypothetical protein [Chloroflexota bacterium]